LPSDFKNKPLIIEEVKGDQYGGKEAFKVTLSMDLGHLFRYVSSVVSRAPSDITRLRESQSKIEELLDYRDMTLLDKAYTGFDTESTKANWVIKKKPPRNCPLTLEERNFN
jgi:hypothetical protein